MKPIKKENYFKIEGMSMIRQNFREIFFCLILFYTLTISIFFVIHLKDGYVVIDFCSVLLCDTLSDPHNVATFLFFELQVRVKDAKMELLDECKNV
jgi:hypothetical protein